MKTVFVVNNKNNRLAKVLPGIEKYFGLQKDLPPPEFRITAGKQHAVQLAREAAENGCEFLIAVGGDGTLHEVINGVCQSTRAAAEYPVIGLLPFGTANDFARTAGISPSFEILANYMRTRSIQKIDLGEIYRPEHRETRYFINIAGIGLGPEVIQGMEGATGRVGARLTYFLHIFRGFLRYRKKEVQCSASTWEWQGNLLQMAVANGKYFGNALCIAPDAQPANGQFEVAIFGDVRIWDYLKNLGKLKKGIRINHPEVSYHTAKEIKLKCKESCGIEADGEYVGLLPATIRIRPKALSFLMPLAVH